MPNSNAGDVAKQNFVTTWKKNAGVALKIFTLLISVSTIIQEKYTTTCPDFFLVKPGVLEGKELATKKSEKLLLEDCIQRAKARNGYVSVFQISQSKTWLLLAGIVGDAFHDGGCCLQR